MLSCSSDVNYLRQVRANAKLALILPNVENICKANFALSNTSRKRTCSYYAVASKSAASLKVYEVFAMKALKNTKSKQTNEKNKCFPFQ